MNRIFVSAAMLALLSIMSNAHASVTPLHETKPGLPDSGISAGPLILQGFQDLQTNDAQAAKTHFEQAIHAPDFDRLGSDIRYRTLLVTAILEEEDANHRQAHALLVRATSYPQADKLAWFKRLRNAFYIQDTNDAAHSLTVLARRWPDQLQNLYSNTATLLHRQLRDAHQDDIDRDMLDAIFDAGWPSEADGSDYLWHDLALMHIQRGEMKRATEVALGIHMPRAALGLVVDKRFDRITRKHPHAFDVDELLAVQTKQAQADMKAHPHLLAPVLHLQDLYLESGQPAQVLTISDAAVAHAEHGDGEKTYSDFSEKYNWVLDERARALSHMGRWDDAVRVRIRAARRPQQGGMNVSQAINLGALYADLRQPEKAADAIIEIGDMSPFGRMQLEDVKLRIAIERKDTAAVERHMAFLRKHRDDAIGTWQIALLLHGDLDKAEALLIERLQNPKWRSDALASMQHYAPIRRTPIDQLIQDRWRLVTQRPDVLTALHKVGRIMHFNLAR